MVSSPIMFYFKVSFSSNFGFMCLTPYFPQSKTIIDTPNVSATERLMKLFKKLGAVQLECEFTFCSGTEIDPFLPFKPRPF